MTDEPSDTNDGRDGEASAGESAPEPTPEPTDREVVEAASAAAEGLVLDRYRQSEVDDLDVTVRFEDGTLEIDVYLDAPEDPDPAVVAQEAIEAAEAAVDELFEEADADTGA